MSGGADDFGILSLLPPLVAIVLAIVTSRVITSLLIGVAIGALIAAGGNPLTATGGLLETYLWTSLIEPDHIRVFAFTLLMGAMVGVIHRSGGMHALVDRIIVWANDRRRGQLTCWLLGLVIFFDDYANTLLLGGTLRPMADRLRISREKLAYLVDSTSAPVAGLAIVSTWVAGEIGYIQEGLARLGPAGDGMDAFGLFVTSIPYRFYVLGALLFVGLIAWTNRDFGPMLAAERRSLRGEPPARSFASGLEESLDHAPTTTAHWHLAVVPVLVVVAAVAWLLAWTGYRNLPPDEPATWLDVLGASDSYLALVYASLAGLLAAVALSRLEGSLLWSQIRDAAWLGAQAMFPALGILWLAWSLADVTGPEHLKTAEYLGGVVGPWLSAAWIPTVVFLLSAAVAFSTGTSWGTMGILMPLVIELTAQILQRDGATITADNPILVASIAGVLAGSIFGDHCSPLSDTTVLSSRACGCDHIAHVRTQLPYAVVVATVAVVCGTLPVGYGLPVTAALALSTVALVGAAYAFGRKAEVPSDAS